MFGDVLKEMLRRRRLTGYRLANMIDVDASLVTRWINSERFPGPRSLSRIVGALNPSTTERADMFDAIVEYGERNSRG